VNKDFQNYGILAKTRHCGKFAAFTAFDENHGFRAFRDYLLSLILTYIIKMLFNALVL